MEAREIILASTAGAEPVLAGGGLKRSGGFPLFKARSWMLAESSYASPAIVTRSPDKPTDAEKQEWILYRDGPRSSATGQAINNINLGFGNRNPDKDGTTTSVADLTLKPAMTFVLYPANDMLHAFRAGPCPVAAADCSGELGGEEMWGFVPFDQLGKLAPARKIQSRTTKVYMMTSSMRFGDVFIKSADFTIQGVTYKGRWKKMAYFGRGLGGKYYTGLDLTLTGAFTNRSLKATLPTVLWNRGNPDTNDGKCKSGTAGCVGGSNNYANTSSATAGAFDYNAYLGMGETWSTPSMARVDPAFNTTLRTPTASGGISFALYAGSGFTDTPTEGSTFYALDAITGDVINSKNVGDNASASLGRAFRPERPRGRRGRLRAQPAGGGNEPAQPGERDRDPCLHRRHARTPLEIPDRRPRILDHDRSLRRPRPGPADRRGRRAAQLRQHGLGRREAAHLRLHGRRLAGGVPPAFRMFGFKEESTRRRDRAHRVPGRPSRHPTRSAPGSAGRCSRPPPSTTRTSDGSSSPAPGSIPPGAATACPASTSLIGALTAGTGSAAYDLSAGGDDRFVEIKGKVITSPNTSTGKPEVVTGDRISAPPLPPPPPKQVGGLGTAVSVVGMGGPGGAPLYRMVSGVCN